MEYQALRSEWTNAGRSVERRVAGDGKSGCGDLTVDGGRYEAGT